MKFVVIAFIAAILLSACNTESAHKLASGGGANNKLSDPAVIISGKPANFNGEWAGTGTLTEDRFSKSTFDFYVITKQNLDANNLPIDFEFSISVLDKNGDIIYGASLSGLTIKMRTDKKDAEVKEIYEIFSNSKKIGVIGTNGFNLEHNENGRVLIFETQQKGVKFVMTFKGHKQIIKDKIKRTIDMTATLNKVK